MPKRWGFCLRNNHHCVLKYPMKLYFWLKNKKGWYKHLLLWSLLLFRRKRTFKNTPGITEKLQSRDLGLL